MKQIRIQRNGNNVVTFETVTIDTTDQVFFTNEDPKAAHWPTLTTNQLGPAPSPNSSQCTVPPSSETIPAAPFTYTYTCKIAGHENESGIVNVVPILAAGTTSLPQTVLNQNLQPTPVVVGGVSPYQISNALFQILGDGGSVIQQGSGSIGPGLVLTPQPNNGGILVGGAPTVAGTYNFTFTVNDGSGRNLQQVQYSLPVVAV